jgi:hypothetical protein
VDGKLHGLIDIYDTRERDYSEYLSFLKVAGQALAGAFANALLGDRCDRGSRMLRETGDLGALISQNRDPHDMPGALAERLRATMEAADCDVYTLQGETLRCVVSVDLGRTRWDGRGRGTTASTAASCAP